MSWLDYGPLLSIVVGYLLFLFGVAYWAERTRRLDAASGEGHITATRTVPLYPSRGFDSGEAMQKLAVMAATGVSDAGAQPAAGIGNALRGVWGDPDRRIFAAAMAVAIVGAAVIALV